MEYKNIENYVYEKIINKEDSKELREIHTQMLIKCSMGDVAAKKYVKTLIKNILSILIFAFLSTRVLKAQTNRCSCHRCRQEQ